MPLLHQIQEAVVQEGAALAPILMKLRFLASRLGSDILEEWVKHESEGYPDEVEVPSYRVTGISYIGTFWGAFGAQINNAPIPTHLIKEHAGESWVTYKIRESIAVVDELVKSGNESGSLGIDASNLMLLLQGKIYEGYGCNAVSGTFSPTALIGIQQAVRNRILELTIELEKSIPAAAEVTFGALNVTVPNPEKAQQISQQIIYGDVTNAVAGGHSWNLTVNINERDSNSFIQSLIESGIAEDDASSLVSILEAEEPESATEPFGEKAKQWVASNIKKATDGSWRVGISVATSVLTEAVKKYYGF